MANEIMLSLSRSSFFPFPSLIHTCDTCYTSIIKWFLVNGNNTHQAIERWHWMNTGQSVLQCLWQRTPLQWCLQGMNPQGCSCLWVWQLHCCQWHQELAKWPPWFESQLVGWEWCLQSNQRLMGVDHLLHHLVCRVDNNQTKFNSNNNLVINLKK